jgi:hypothetical protein
LGAARGGKGVPSRVAMLGLEDAQGEEAWRKKRKSLLIVAAVVLTPVASASRQAVVVESVMRSLVHLHVERKWHQGKEQIRAAAQRGEDDHVLRSSGRTETWEDQPLTSVATAVAW